MNEQTERQLALLAELLREVIQNPMQMALVLASNHDPHKPLSDLLANRISAGLFRIAETIDAYSSLDFPSDLARSLHTNASRLRDLGDHEGDTGGS